MHMERYHGTHPPISPEHRGRYVIELTGRYNDRPPDTYAQLAHVVQVKDGEQLPYQDLIARGSAH